MLPIAIVAIIMAMRIVRRLYRSYEGRRERVGLTMNVILFALSSRGSLGMCHPEGALVPLSS